MKVYVVSSGSYSDYYIDKMFLNPERAKLYHSLCNHYDLNDIEEYELSDDEFFTPYYYVDFKYYISGMEEKFRQSSHRIDKPHLIGGQYYIDIGQCLNTDTYSTQRSTSYANGIITLHRPIGLNKENIDLDALAEKYLKVCHDLEAQIKYWFFTGGSEYNVRRMFGDNFAEIDDVAIVVGGK